MTYARPSAAPVAGLDADPPFSFRYAGEASAALLAAWPRRVEPEVIDAGRRRRTIVWTAPDGLEVRWIADSYTDEPVVEWRVEFANTAATESAPLSEVLAVDTIIGTRSESSPRVRTNSGSASVAADFAPLAYSLDANSSHLLFFPAGGKSSSGQPSDHPVAIGAGWPYFNLDWGDEGAIVALGWPGQWGMQLSPAEDGAVAVQGGMANADSVSGAAPVLTDLDLTDLYLHAGETIRTPLVVVMSWRGGDWLDAQNAWRRWFLRHNTPRMPGDLPPSPMCPTGSVCGSYNYTLDSTEHELDFMRQYREHGLTPAAGGAMNWWWIDAGWYTIPAKVDPLDVLAWTHTGTWEPDPARYPDGLRPITDQARADGMQVIIWHEPERCRPGTWLHDTHPDWLLEASEPEHRYLNLGHPDARRWVLETFDELIDRNGADLFRQDFNYHGPLPYWNLTDDDGRRGATQIHYVEGLLYFWDELRSRHPGMLIDNCASGGRRLDVESLRRSVAMSQSDDVRDPEGSQAQFMGLSTWLVCHGTSARTDSLYSLRSSMNWLFEIHLDGIGDEPASDEQWERLRIATEEWRRVSPSYLGAFYPLTPYRCDTASWASYQYHRADLDSGVVHIFARPDATEATLTVHPRGLLADATYTLTDADRPTATEERAGSDLMLTGITVAASEYPYAATISYCRAVTG